MPAVPGGTGPGMGTRRRRRRRQGALGRAVLPPPGTTVSVWQGDKPEACKDTESPKAGAVCRR